MQKFINRSENITREMLEGLVLANQDKLMLVGGQLVVNKKLAQAKRVTVIALGMTGCEPALCGCVGEGLLDIFVAGDVFAAPGPQAALDAVRLADKGQGVLLIAGNHTGDMLTANLVMKLAQKESLNVQLVVVHDNLGDAPRSSLQERRSLVGIVPVCKIAAAAALAGKSLADVAALAQSFADNMSTIAVTVKPGTNPQTGAPLAAELKAEMCAVGAGEQAEGGELVPLMQADELAEAVIPKLLADLQVQQGEKLLFMVNGSGATTLMEQLIIYRAGYNVLAERGVEVTASYVGGLMTTQDTYGVQLLLARMDDELLDYWQEECDAPYFKK